jgi:hypothetical protein
MPGALVERDELYHFPLVSPHQVVGRNFAALVAEPLFCACEVLAGGIVYDYKLWVEKFAAAIRTEHKGKYTMKAKKTKIKPLTAGRVARRLLAFFKTHKWCQGNYARHKDGWSTLGSDPNAVSFCAVGAIQVILPKGAPESREFEAKEVVEAALSKHCHYHEGLLNFNDDCANFDEFKAAMHKIARLP